MMTIDEARQIVSDADRLQQARELLAVENARNLLVQTNGCRKRDHPGRSLYRQQFWRGRQLTEAEDILARDYWSKHVQEPFYAGEGY